MLDNITQNGRIMKTKKILSMLLLTAVAAAAFAQTAAEVEQKAKPRPKDSSRFGLKASYDAPDPNFGSHLRSDMDWGEAAGIARSGMAGFTLKIPIGRTFYVQPEALFGFTSDWAGAGAQTGVFDQLAYGFSNRTSTNFDVPLYVGAKWSRSKLFRVRGYAGPRFHFAWVGKEFYKDFNSFDISAGAGIDLFDFVSVDVGYRVGMNGFNIIDNSGRWTLSAGLLL